MREQETEHARFIIDRFDHYFESTNTKGNLYLAINTFLIGGILSGYTFLDQQFAFVFFTKVLIIIMLLACLGSLQCSMFAINPYTSRGNAAHSRSMIFFGDVAPLDSGDYHRDFTTQTEEERLADLTRQISVLSKGLMNKYKWLTRAGWLLYTAFTLLFFISLITLIIYLNGK